jgi:hypothetical protein
MKRLILAKKLILVIIILPMLIGCSPSPSATSDPQTIDPETTDPKSTSDFEAEFEVIFDGKDCTATGPAEVTAGEHSFVFIDRSEYEGELWLVNVDEGHTYQESLDLQSEPGEWYPKPDWHHYDYTASRESQQLDGERIDREVWKLDKVGLHVILCYVSSPQLIWFPAPIMVVEAPAQ